jgi:hypothetical protein
MRGAVIQFHGSASRTSLRFEDRPRRRSNHRGWLNRAMDAAAVDLALDVRVGDLAPGECRGYDVGPWQVCTIQITYFRHFGTFKFFPYGKGKPRIHDQMRNDFPCTGLFRSYVWAGESSHKGNSVK